MKLHKFIHVTIFCDDNRSKEKCVKMGQDDAGCTYSQGAGVCARDLPCSDCLRFHFVTADVLKSGSFPCCVKDSGEVRISEGTRVFQALLYFVLTVFFVYFCISNETRCIFYYVGRLRSKVS